MNPAHYPTIETGKKMGGVNILIAAGGSGGHIFPALALAKELLNGQGPVRIKFIGSRKDLDKRIFEKEHFDFELLSANKFPYGFSGQIFVFFAKLSIDLIKALRIIAVYKPDVVVGFGGYVPCPVFLAAYLFGIPRIVHEQNVVPGRANKVLFALAGRVALSFDETKAFMGSFAKKAVLTGNPIRIEDFKSADVAAGKDFCSRKFGLDGSKFTILVIGGSQGAHFLNEAFIGAMSGLDEGLKRSMQAIHITGIKDYEQATKSYEHLGVSARIYSFIDRIEEAYGAADLVVTRAGASAIFELAFFAKPMILVPYKFAMSHQAQNARAFSSREAAIVISEDVLSAQAFREVFTGLFNDRERLGRMASAAGSMAVPDASRHLAREVLDLAKG